MKKIYYTLFYMHLLLLSAASFAQNPEGLGNQPGMAVGMRSNGKIYVVIAVIVTILSGLFIYLVNLDKKITRMEKELKQDKGNKTIII